MPVAVPEEWLLQFLSCSKCLNNGSDGCDFRLWFGSGAWQNFRVGQFLMLFFANVLHVGAQPPSPHKSVNAWIKTSRSVA